MFPNLHLKRLDPCVSARRRPAEHLACPTKPGRCVGALRRPAIALSLVLTLLMLPSSIVQANVYPTNIKVNDGFTNITATAGSSIAISYILNEPASAGVTIQLVSGGIAVRTIAIPGGASGTLRGLNQVSWDGKDNASNNAAPGTYALSITAASHGYPVWTQTTDDNTNGNVVYEGRGIAVNRNTNSPFYGRIYVSNAAESTAGQPDWLGFHVGIVKCNADASFADEGGLSTGGYPWAGDNFSPWHIAVAPNDSVYIDDFTTNGQVISWDATIAEATQTPVLRPDNWPNLNVSLSGPALSGSDTNQALWMADATFNSTSNGLGILRYSLKPDGTCALNDTGRVAVAVGGSLTGNPVDVALDASGNIYTILPTEDPADPANRVFRFPPFDPATNKTALTMAQWAVGSKDDTMVGARGIAVDPTSTYVAVAFEDPLGSNGCTQIFFATNGSLVTNLDLGMVISGMSTHQDEDCAWDAVGNVYYIDNLFSVWRAVSPPGTNRATTVGLPTIQITRGSGGGPSVSPKITGLTVSNGVVALSFSGGTNDVPSDFSIQAAGSVTGPYVAITATIVAVGPGQFRATFPVGTGVEYYRVAGQGSTPPPSQLSFSHVKLSGNNLLLTFTAATNETAAAFTVLSAQTANGAFSPVSNPAISQISPGVFQATVAVSGPARFYRIKQ